jgi:hypothetical protein
MQNGSPNQALAGRASTEEAGDTVSLPSALNPRIKLTYQTLVDELCDTSFESQQGEKGWTGLIPNVSSSSRSSPTSPPLHHRGHALGKQEEEKQTNMKMEQFGERFKYMLCTSGLLEKVYVPCLGGFMPVRKEEEEVDLHTSLDSGPDENTMKMDDWRARGVEEALLWMRKMRDRPDIALAGLVLLVAIAWVVGWKLVLLVIVSGMGAVGAFWKRQTSGLPTRSDQVSDRGHGPYTILTIQADNSVDSTTSNRTEPSNDTLVSLQSLLTASASLDLTIESALSVFRGYPDSSSLHHDLRLAIHRLTETMADHLGTATSTLLEMVDRTELGILGELYDIPIGPNNDRRGRANTNLSDDQENINSLKRLSWNASKPLIPFSLPMSTSASSPARLRLDRKHTVHLSLGGMPLEDRFTSVPKRTARAIKRSSWAPEWNDRIANGTDLNTLAANPASSTGSSELQTSFSEESKETELPRTPNPQRASVTPRRSSPLSRRDSNSSDSHMPQRHIFPIVPPTPAKHPLLPSPFKSPVREDQKRRSLQSMPYFHSDKSDVTSPGRASISGSSDMGRSTSLQVSDLQMLRDQSTHGLVAPNSIESMASARMFQLGHGHSHGHTPTRPSRIVRSPSLSPLTLPGLKAACLGVHMKRRKVACCLLGLRFDQDDEYWMEVKRVLDDLVLGIDSAVELLQAAEQEAKVSDSTLRPVQQQTTVPPWLTGVHSTADRPDYAPRTSDHALLNQQIENLEATLHQTWTDLQAMRSGIDSTDHLGHSWTGIRSDLGELICHWERGKDIVSRLDASNRSDLAGNEGEEGDLEPLPTFLRAWDEDLEPSSNATDSVRSTSVDTHDTFSSHAHDMSLLDTLATEILPPPGQDTVFESVPMPVNIQRSRLTREERIKLMKEARESAPQPVEARGVAEMGGDVVGELKSMIGIIRKRKGIPETEPNPVASRATEEDVTRRDERPRLPMGFADDLRKAFVFPTTHVEKQDYNQNS